MIIRNEYSVEIETKHEDVTFVVKLEEELSNSWLEKWEESFYNINTMEGHARNIVSMLESFMSRVGKAPGFLVCYGPVKFTGIRSWELTILDDKGDKATTAEIKRLPTIAQGQRYGRKKKRS